MLYQFHFILWDLTNACVIPLKLFLNHDKGITIFFPTEQVSAHWDLSPTAKRCIFFLLKQMWNINAGWGARFLWSLSLIFIPHRGCIWLMRCHVARGTITSDESGLVGRFMCNMVPKGLDICLLWAMALLDMDWLLVITWMVVVWSPRGILRHNKTQWVCLGWHMLLIKTSAQSGVVEWLLWTNTESHTIHKWAMDWMYKPDTAESGV